MADKLDIRNLFQGWFCDCYSEVEIALLYGEIYHELKRGMEEGFELLAQAKREG